MVDMHVAVSTVLCCRDGNGVQIMKRIVSSSVNAFLKTETKVNIDNVICKCWMNLAQSVIE